MTLILLAIIAYPSARSIDRWVQRMENGVFIRRGQKLHDEALALKRDAARRAAQRADMHEQAVRKP